jgi:hypothetical protein
MNNNFNEKILYCAREIIQEAIKIHDLVEEQIIWYELWKDLEEINLVYNGKLGYGHFTSGDDKKTKEE